ERQLVEFDPGIRNLITAVDDKRTWNGDEAFYIRERKEMPEAFNLSKELNILVPVICRIIKESFHYMP
ncbi:34084_t:CDS:2, partial [Racocetra persica]